MSRSYLTRTKSGVPGINALLAVLCPVSLAAAPINATAAVLSTALAGNNNDLDITAKRKGVYGNGITVRYVDPGLPSQALAVSVVAKAISVSLATDAGTPQVETATVIAAAGATGSGNLAVTVTSALLVPAVTVQVALVQATHTTAALIATAIRAALAADATLNTFFTFGGAGADVVMTRRAAYARANDATENVAWPLTLGITAVVNSANTTAGVVAAITSTAALITAAIAASVDANALVSVANKAGNDGTGVVIALAATNLAAAVDGTDAEPYQQGTYGGYLYMNVRDTAAVAGATDTWYKTQLTLVA